MTDRFSYVSLLTANHRENGYSAGLDKSRNWVMFQPAASASEAEQSGWKVHLSVKHAHLHRAWDVVTKVLQNASSGGQPLTDAQKLIAKVAAPENAEAFADPRNPQRGKMITLAERAPLPPETWKGVLTAVEQGFVTAGVQPGLAVIGEHAIPGSRFASYRHDRNADGSYRDATDIPQIYAPGQNKFEDVALNTPAGHPRRVRLTAPGR